MVEDLERRLATDGQLERHAQPLVDDEHGERVVARIPEERDLEAVALAVCELFALHAAIFTALGNAGSTAG
jgi:hypothetical protein